MNGHHSPRQVVFAFAVGRAEEAICPSWLAQQGSPAFLQVGFCILWQLEGS